jgi:hypothetical protein
VRKSRKDTNEKIAFTLNEFRKTLNLYLTGSQPNLITCIIDPNDDSKYRSNIYKDVKTYLRSIKNKVTKEDIEDAIDVIGSISQNNSTKDIYRYIYPDNLTTSKECKDLLKELEWESKVAKETIMRKKIDSENLNMALLMNESEAIIYDGLRQTKIIFTNDICLVSNCDELFSQLWKLSYEYDYLIDEIYTTLSAQRNRKIFQLISAKCENKEVDGIALGFIRKHYGWSDPDVCQRIDKLENSGLFSSLPNPKGAKHKVRLTYIGNIVEEQRRTLEFIIRNKDKFEKSNLHYRDIPLNLQNCFGLLNKTELITDKRFIDNITKDIIKEIEKFLMVIDKHLTKDQIEAINERTKSTTDPFRFYFISSPSTEGPNAPISNEKYQINKISNNEICITVFLNEKRGIIILPSDDLLAFYGDRREVIRWCMQYYIHLIHSDLECFYK